MSDRKNNAIFLDNASTTAMRMETLEAMEPYFLEDYGNPSSIHSMGRTPREACQRARKTISYIINAEPEEIFFTSGGTESDNWAITSVARKAGKEKNIVVSKIEHHAILETAEALEKEGFRIRRVGVDADGLVDLEELKTLVDEDTALVSVMTANNEIGTIQPLKEISKIAHAKGALFHTDAVQAMCHIPIDVRDMGIDMLSASGHKFGAPKGIGFLFVRKGVRLDPFMRGGAQEEGRRAGTTNVPGIVGMGKAAELESAGMARKMREISEMRDHAIERIEKEIPYAKLNGHRERRLPGNVNFSFRFVEGESLLMMLNAAGICVSTGSACASGSLDPSHVLLAIGLPHEIAHGSIRMSLSDRNTMEEIDKAVDVLKSSIERLRSMSPLYEDYVKKEKCQRCHTTEFTAIR